MWRWIKSVVLATTLVATCFANSAAMAGESVDPHILPDFYDQSIPRYLQPSLANASHDYPKPYFDGCHTQQNMIQNLNKCEYGNLKSKTTVILFGDSHALSWFPTLEKLALYKNWKLISLTMSSCWPASIPAWNSTTKILMTNCEMWRDSAFTQLAKIKPKYIFVAGTSGFSTLDANGQVAVGQTRVDIWRKGMNETLNKLVADTSKVFYIADYPIATSDPINCLSHAKSLISCVIPLNAAVNFNWLQLEHDVVIENGAIFIDATELICETDPCAPISNNLIKYRDAGHLTATFAKSLFSQLYRVLKLTSIN